jgi:hypothetical protein
VQSTTGRIPQPLNGCYIELIPLRSSPSPVARMPPQVHAPATAATTPVAHLDDLASQHGAVRFQVLAG